MIIPRSRRAKKILSIRSKYGRAESHEMLLFKTPQHTYCYVLDLRAKRVLFSVSTMTLKKLGKSNGVKGVALAGMVGKMVGERCKKDGIKPVVNVANYKYHGRVASLVEGFRSVVNA